MEKSIKTTSLIVLVISIFAAVSNLSGAFMTFMLDLDIPFFLHICGVTATIGILYIIGGYFMLKRRFWSRTYLLNLSRIIIVGTVSFFFYAMIALSWDDDTFLVKLASIMAIIFYGVPLSLLIRFLKRKDVKDHFAQLLI